MVPQSTGYFKQSRLASTLHLVLVSLGTSLKALLMEALCFHWNNFTEQECHLYLSIGALNQNDLHSGEARQTCLGFHVWSSRINTSAHAPCTKKKKFKLGCIESLIRLYTHESLSWFTLRLAVGAWIYYLKTTLLNFILTPHTESHKSTLYTNRTLKKGTENLAFFVCLVLFCFEDRVSLC